MHPLNQHWHAVIFFNDPHRFLPPNTPERFLNAVGGTGKVETYETGRNSTSPLFLPLFWDLINPLRVLAYGGACAITKNSNYE